MRELRELYNYAAFSAERFVRRLRGKAAAKISPTPHLDDEALKMFMSLVAGRRYLEYGAGGSTVWAANHAKQVVSVDSDLSYVRALAGIANIHHADIGRTIRWGAPAFTSPTEERLNRWWNYVQMPWRIIPDAEVVLVDGRFRLSCCLYSLSRSDVPVMLDDYASRPHYRRAEDFADIQMAGRMAVLKRKRGFDALGCEMAAKSFLNEWR